jgi:MSHA biogenesis protein MshO
MRPIRPERGVTLIELVVAIVLVAIIVAAVAFFLNPIRQSTDLALRAELTDIADNTLQRIGREVKLALPNSVRSKTSGGVVYLEFLALRTGGRYRAGGGGVASGADCPDDGSGLPGSDQLTFGAVDTCFKTIGKLSDAIVANSDHLVLFNLGPDPSGLDPVGYLDQNAYAAAAANRVLITSVDTSEGNRDRIVFIAKTFSQARHDSPSKRFFVVSGAVSYVCDPAAGTITRRWGYTESALQPDSFSDGSAALIAQNVSACAFDYNPSVSPQLGILTMRIRLQSALFGGANETVSLYHAVHVNNAP